MNSHSIFVIFIYYFLVGHVRIWGQGYPKPTIRAIPSRVINKGGDLTIRCEAPSMGAEFFLTNVIYINNTHKKTDGNVADFYLTDDILKENAQFYCNYRYFQSGYSDNSDTLTIKVVDIKKPTISFKQKSNDAEGRSTIVCTAPETPKGYILKRFFLNKGKALKTDRNYQWENLTVEFTETVNKSEQYRCSYVLQITEEPRDAIISPLSDPLPTSKDDEAIVTDDASNDDDAIVTDDASKIFLIPVISAVSSVLLLIFAVILVYYILRKHKTSPDKKLDSDLPLTDQVTTNIDGTYCSVEECVQRVYPDVEMKVQKEDNKCDDGITYAVLNKKALQTKKPMSSTPEDSSLYAEVRKKANI
ncbi:uncharacterized protein O3C94_013233 isoform 2-T2 [Discoglossus pictus]